MGFLTMDSFSGMLEGGEPILYQGQLVGAMGVSGVKSFQDAEIALQAIESFGTTQLGVSIWKIQNHREYE